MDEHDVPYSMEHRTTAVPAQVKVNNENKMPTATPASQNPPEPETGQGGPWLVEDDRARRDQKLRSLLRDTGPVPAPKVRTDSPPEPIEYDYSEVDEENANDLCKRGDK